MSAQDNQLALYPVGENALITTVGEELNRISGNIAAAYVAVKSKGVTIPAATAETSDNLPGAIDSIKVAAITCIPDTNDPQRYILTISTQ